jgi:isoquinoline 1-oxidoreductase subunit beta
MSMGANGEKKDPGMKRRVFLGIVASAGAFAVGCGEAPVVPPQTGDVEPAKDKPPTEPAKAEAAKGPFVPDAWIRVAADGTVTTMIDKAEMGQGVETALAMLVAEELEVPLASIKTQWAPVDPPKYKNKLFGMQATGGSTTIRGDYVPLRKAAAAARMMLVSAAAEKLGVPAGELEAKSGAVVHAKSSKRVSYGELVDLAGKQAVPQDPPLKPAAELDVLGTRPQRLDAVSKGAGKAMFGLDVKIPGMLTAVVVRSPVSGGKVTKFEALKAQAVPGVRKVVQISNGVAVVADHFWAAKKGAELLEVTWNEGANAALSSEKILADAKKLVKKPGVVALTKGDFDGAWKKAKKKIEAAYELPFQSHAPMEPPSATAHVRADGVELWVAHQALEWAQGGVAKALGVDPKTIKINLTYLGGGFGRRAETDFVVEAAEVSKAVGAPVKVVWTREDDIRHDFYRPTTYTPVMAALGDDGMPVGVRYQVVSGSIAARVFPQLMKNGIDHSAIEGLAEQYDFPNAKVEWHRQDTVPVGFWRSVGHSTNAFVEECLLDEMAALAKIDPVEYRKKLTAKEPRLWKVIELAAEKAGWGKPLAKGRGRGIAAHVSFGSYVAQVAEVTVDKGQVKVDRVVCVVDCGAIVHPGIVEAQMEGGIVYGLTAALKSGITLEKGRVKQANFHNFKLLAMDEAPKIEVYIMPSTEKSGGTGEPGTPPIAPAVANAIFAATGKRIRRLPIQAADLK